VNPRALGRYAALAVAALLTVSAALSMAQGPRGRGRAVRDRTPSLLILPIPDAIRAVDPQVSRRDTPTIEKRSRPGPLLLAPFSGNAVSDLLPTVSMAHPGPGAAPSFIAFRTPLTRAPPTLPAA
jgi:hypothetical protein